MKRSPSSKNNETEINLAAENAVKLIKEAAAENVKILATAARDAATLIASATSDASRLVASDAATAVKVLNVKNADGGSDHDVLNTLVGSVANLEKNFTEKFADLKADIRSLSDGTSTQISNHENRLNALEISKTRQNVMMSIGIGILTLLASLLTYHLVK